MKKAILTVGLFSMMMILTSFTSDTEIGGDNQNKPKDPIPLRFDNLEIGGNNQNKPKDTNPLGYNEIGGNNQNKPKDTNPLG